MEIGLLTRENLGVFRTLLLPRMAQALEEDEPVLALGMSEDDVAVGALAGYLEDGWFRIASLYVAPKYRRRGGGHRMMATLVWLLKGQADGMTIQFAATREEHLSLFRFLEAVGFCLEEDLGENIYRTTLGKAAESPLLTPKGEAVGTSFAQLSDKVLAALEREAEAAHAPMPEGGMSDPQVDRDVSLVYEKDGAVQAYVVADTGWKGGLTLSGVWSRSQDSTLLPRLLRTALARAMKKYPPETVVLVQAVNLSSAALVESLLPEAAPISFAYRFWFTV